MESPTQFAGALILAAMEALREAGLTPALLEVAGPSDEARVEEALSRVTGLEAPALARLREALIAVGDHEAGVEAVRILEPSEDLRGAVAVGGHHYLVVRAPSGRRKRTRKARASPKSPALVTIIRSADRARAAAAPAVAAEVPPQAPTSPEEPLTAALGSQARRQLPAGRGRFTSGGKLEGGGTPNAAAWTRPPVEEARAARAPREGREKKGPDRRRGGPRPHRTR